MKKVTILALIFSIVLISCKENQNPATPTKNIIEGFLPYTGLTYSFNDLIRNYDNGNIQGILILSKIKNNALVYSSSNGVPIANYFDKYENDARAYLTNSNGSPASALDFLVNSISMNPYTAGVYYCVKSDELDVFCKNAYNKFAIRKSDEFQNYTDSVLFGEEIFIYSHKYNDTIYSNQDFSIAWSGGTSQSKIGLKMERNDPIGFVSTTPDKYRSFEIILDNSNSFNFKAGFLNNIGLEEGYYDLKVSAYEPFYRKLPNLKDLLVISDISHNLTVYVKH